MNRLLVSSRTRPDIDLPKFLGMYEFSVIPPSIFTPDGSLYYPKIKLQLSPTFETFSRKKKMKILKMVLAPPERLS